MHSFHYLKSSLNILDFNPYNIWDSEHIDIDGTTTTLIDFNNVGTTYDMANPAASNQATFNASSANFGGKPSFTFDGIDDYFINDVSNYRNTDSSGIIISVFKAISGSDIGFFELGSSSNLARFLENKVLSDSLRPILGTNSGFRSFRGVDNVNLGSKVIAYGSNSASYLMYINSNSQLITPTSGANDGLFLNEMSSLTNISIGALIQVSGIYSNIEWCMSGYFPYVSDARTIEISNFLKSYYGIV